MIVVPREGNFYYQNLNETILNHNNFKNILMFPLGTAFVFSIISMIIIIIAPGNEIRL